MLERQGADLVDVETAPIIGNLNYNVTALVAGRQPYLAATRLASREPLGGHFDAMIRAVADEMSERILDHFQNLAVEFRVGSVHLEFDLFPEFGAKVAHDPRQFLPRVADRLHACLHYAFLQLSGNV